MENKDKPTKPTSTKSSVKKKKTQSPKIQFRTDKVESTYGDNDNSIGGMVQSLKDNMAATDHVKSLLQKSIKPQTHKKDLKGKYSKSKAVFVSRQDSLDFNNTLEKGWTRISDEELKSIAQADPYISAIISTRCSQGAIIGRPSDSKFDKGTRVLDLNPMTLTDFPDKHEFERYQRDTKVKLKSILDWFSTCGTSNPDVINEVFRDEDPTFKSCSLPEFIVAQIRNLLTFGRMGTQLIRDDKGVIVMFRPVPIESIKLVPFGRQVFVSDNQDTSEESLADVAKYNEMPENERPLAYVQKVAGNYSVFFSEQDLKVNYFQKQALYDLRGYPLAPIEQAIYMTFVHQQTLAYLRNHFVKGIGAKSMLVIKSQDASTQLSEEDLDTLRSQFHNYVNRNDNSAVTPVLSGPIDVNVIPLSANPKDMEFLQLEEHIIRALCSAMQISPQEMGYGSLSIGQGGMTQANKQEEIIRGEERGLRMLLDTVYDCLNEILHEHFPEAKQRFRLAYTGVGEDTRDAVINRSMTEMQTTATMASLFADSEKTEPIPFGGNVPLAPLFHSNVVRYMKYGKFMEDFYGCEGWSAKPEYDFIIDPELNQSYQRLKAQPIQMQQEQAQLALEGQKSEVEGMQQQQQMQSQQAEMANQQAMMEQMHGAPGQGQEQAQEQPEAEPAEKSISLAEAFLENVPRKEADETPKVQTLRDALMEHQLLQKSYFSEWLNANKIED